MQRYKFEGKTIEEAKEEAFYNLNKKEEEVIYETREISAGFLKGKKVEIEVILLDDVLNYAKDLIKKITSLMGIDVNIESKLREGSLYLKMYSDNNAILIGKMGRTLTSLQIIVKQSIQNLVGKNVNILLDVENYKEKQNINLERLAKRLAREVNQTKIEVKMDPMNSYQRRIVHSVLSDNRYVYTESVGEEPNRYIVIKAKGDK